jgi:hypothetical protein
MEIDMAKKPENHGKEWASKDEAQLKKLIAGNTPTPLMGSKLGRTPAAVQKHANDLNLSTKPTNKSPYGTNGKSK